MPASLDPALVDQVASRIAAGDSNSAIGAALNLGRNSIAGIIGRLRQAGDHRVPPAGTRGRPVVAAASERDALAEAFAQGAPSLNQAAKVAGLAPTTADRRWKEIRANLGWQAS